MEQTAMQQLLAYIKHNGSSYRAISADMIEKEFIPMEKKQIIDAHGDERSYLQNDGGWKIISAEQYYNDTYKK